MRPAFCEVMEIGALNAAVALRMKSRGRRSECVYVSATSCARTPVSP